LQFHAAANGQPSETEQEEEMAALIATPTGTPTSLGSSRNARAVGNMLESLRKQNATKEEIKSLMISGQLLRARLKHTLPLQS